MNYEQKYNEVLEWARKNKARLNGVPIEEVLPELRESEDERIRQEILDFVLYKPKGSPTDEEQDRWVAWLEKQKEQKPNQSKEEREYVKTLKGLVSDFIRDSGGGISDVAYYQKICDWLDGRHIGQKPAEWSDTNELVFQDICNHLKVEGYGGWVLFLKALRNEKFQPKQKWSEVDEKMINDCIHAIEYELIDNGQDEQVATDPRIAFLKSLPERFSIQPIQEWSNDDQLRRNICACACKAVMEDYPDSADHYKKGLDWLENIQPQAKQEWSEEDEKMRNLLIETLDDNSHFFPFKETKKKMSDWLKSLKPQYHGDVTMTEAYKMGLEAGKASSWKPSEKWRHYIWATNLRFDFTALIRYDNTDSYEIVLAGNRPKQEKNGVYIFIKDIKPQSQWRPSDEQLKHLLMLADYFESEGAISNAKTLRELYEQLKKLM